MAPRKLNQKSGKKLKSNAIKDYSLSTTKSASRMANEKKKRKESSSSRIMKEVQDKENIDMISEFSSELNTQLSKDDTVEGDEDEGIEEVSSDYVGQSSSSDNLEELMHMFQVEKKTSDSRTIYDKAIQDKLSEFQLSLNKDIKKQKSRVKSIISRMETELETIRKSMVDKSNIQQPIKGKQNSKLRSNEPVMIDLEQYEDYLNQIEANSKLISESMEKTAEMRLILESIGGVAAVGQDLYTKFLDEMQVQKCTAQSLVEQGILASIDRLFAPQN